jgi:hypothetical protein
MVKPYERGVEHEYTNKDEVADHRGSVWKL